MIWREIPVRALFRRRNQTGRPELPLLSVYRDLGVVPRTGRDDNFNRPGDDLTTYRVVRPGDLVLNKMKTWQGSLGVSGYEGLVSPAYFVAEPRSAESPRFLHYLLRSLPLIAQYAARSKGIRPAQWDLSWEAFSSISISLPSKQCQAAIAMFLDVENTRIDALIEKKRQMLQLLTGRSAGIVEQGVRDLAERHGEQQRLKTMVRDITVGIVVKPSVWYSDPNPRVAGRVDLLLCC